MDLERLRTSPIGQLVPISGVDAKHGPYQYWAYLPDTLPGTLEFSGETWNAITAATAELARLDQAALQIPNAALLRRPTLRREAQSTSALEGTVVAFTELLEAEQAADRPAAPAMREVLNYIRAAEDAYQWVVERPVTIALLEGLQTTLTDGIDVAGSGTLRERQVAIGTMGRPITEARFVPQPPGDTLRSSLEALLDWIQQSRGFLPVVRAALAHYQFETIHPFTDGNGRIGRLMIVLQLVRDHVLREPVLIVSPWFEARRREYQDALLNLSLTGDYDEWVRFFCHGIEAQAADTTQRITRLLALQQSHQTQTREAGLRGVAVQIAEGLIEHPILNVTAMAARYGVTFPAANGAIERLVGLGLLREFTGRSRDRWYEATDVLDAIEAPL
jgi:Fic family protein